MKKLFKHYLITISASAFCALLPFMMQFMMQFDVSFSLKYAFAVAVLMVPISALYLLRQGVPLRMRLLFLLLNPCGIFALFGWCASIYFTLFPMDFSNFSFGGM